MAANFGFRRRDIQYRSLSPVAVPHNPRATFPRPRRPATTALRQRSPLRSPLRQQSPLPVQRDDNRSRAITIHVEATPAKRGEEERAEQETPVKLQVAQVNKEEEEEKSMQDKSPHVDSMPLSFAMVSLPVGLYFFLSLKFYEPIKVKALDLKRTLEFRGHRVFLYDPKVHGPNFGYAVSKALGQTNRMVSFVTHEPPYGVRTQNFGNKCMDSTYDELNYYHAWGKDVRPLKMYTGGRWPPTTALATKDAGEEGYYLMKRVFLPNLSFHEVSTWDVERVADFVCTR